MVATHFGGSLGLSFHSSLSTIEFTQPARALVDMPIGLPNRGKRRCDELARELLGSRRSTIFSIPSRAAVYAGSYTECCDINFLDQGCKVSKQAWNLIPKIRELDAFTRAVPTRHEFIAEAHPELAFKALAPNSWPLAPKRSPEGLATRREILSRALNVSVEQIALDFLSKHPKQLDQTDVYDAMSLCAILVASRGAVSFVGSEEVDEFGAPLRICIG